MPEMLWDDKLAGGKSELELLVYRSNLLGADRSVCNIYGGNTGTKADERDFRGRVVRALWVKGSGSDLASMQAKDFCGLLLEDVLPLLERSAMTDAEMVAYLSHCYLGINMPRQSIEALLHAFVPAAHTDHTHPDAVISIACAANGRALAHEIYGERMAWVDYVRPGFALSRQIGQAVRDNPRIECVVMGKHGLVTWGSAHKDTYAHTIATIQKAQDFIADRAKGRVVFGPARRVALPAAQRRELAAQLLPVLRGAAAAASQPHSRSILHWDDSPAVLDFAGSERAQELAIVGAACPDHLVHTKHLPLFIDWDPAGGPDALLARARTALPEFSAGYRAYFDAHAAAGDAMFDPAPRVVLVPGLGMITTGKDALLARVAADLYQRAIQVMHGAAAVDKFISMTPAEAFGVEYWPLELYKLSLRPPERELARRVAFITGGASGIGRAAAHRLAAEGAHVVVADLNLEAAQAVAADISTRHGAQRGLAVRCNVTDEAQVDEAFAAAALAFGGVDIVVSNAGFADSAHIIDTTLAQWNKLFDVLAKGYFLVSRAAFKLWSAQGIGGSLIFVASKNGLIGSKNAAAYGAAKAAEINLARCLAEDGGALGVRVNTVNPDAVLQGSGIWGAGWREARAKGMGVKADDLQETYRQRSTLKLPVYPEDVAEAILFFASERSAKTTGAILNVDAGLPAAYVR